MLPISRDRSTATAAVLLGWLLSSGAQAVSISDCGGPADLLKNARYSINPDPVVKNESFVISLSGTLGADLKEVFVTANLDTVVVLFGKTLLDGKVVRKEVVTMEHGVPAGDVELVVGPLRLPSIPGTANATGQVAFADATGHQVACMALDFDLPMLSDSGAAPESSAPRLAGPAAGEGCTKAEDHLHDASIHKEDDGRIEVMGTLDEDVSEMTFELDLVLRIGFVPLKAVLPVPVRLKPGFKRGESHVQLRPAPGRLSFAAKANQKDEGKEPDLTPIHLLGSVIWKDAEGEEITCAGFNLPIAGDVEEGGDEGQASTAIVV